jgi:hypothetical protein
MKLLAKRATPAAIAVLRQATALYPKRNRLSDGLLPSSAHIKQSPNSDHNTGLAVDLTHDPKNGVDCGSNQHNKHLHISINDESANDTSPWFWWMNQPKAINTLIASVMTTPAKKAYKVPVCTCCKVHSKTK